MGAAVVAGIAWRAGSLSRSGAIAATILGAVSVLADWRWGVLLIGYFVSSSLLSRLGAERKAARTGAIVAKGGARDAWQVMANGGVFGLAAVGAWGMPAAFPWGLLGAGALAASASDTWATEIGTWLGGTPRALLSWAPVPVGTSGGVSAAGCAGAIAGAASIAGLAVLCGWPAREASWLLVAGVAGSIADSLLGATLQARRWCPLCRLSTERAVHTCSTPTERSGGLAWLDNDAVNAAATIAGGVVAVGGWWAAKGSAGIS